MPLENGIYSALNTIPRSIPEEVWGSLLSSKRKILNFFQANPELLIKPYSFARDFDFDRHKFFQTLPMDIENNEVLHLFLQTSLLSHPDVAFDLFSREWKHFRDEYEPDNDLLSDERIEILCCIDFLMGLLSVLSDYVTHRSRIANVYHTAAYVDAVGREYQTKAEAALKKMFAKEHAIDSSDMNYKLHNHVQALLQILKRDEANGSVSRLAAGLPFERHCQALLEEASYKVKTTPTSGDFGADLIAESAELAFAIQCKDHQKTIGIKAAQEALSARAHYRVDYGVVCATSDFSDAAIELASTTKVILCSPSNLVKRLGSI